MRTDKVRPYLDRVGRVCGVKGCTALLHDEARFCARCGASTSFHGGWEAWWQGVFFPARLSGTGLVILVFVILGNAASGGPFARPLLPGLWRTVGGVLPPGASVDLARSALFFDGARIAGAILVLVGWTALGTALAVAFGGRIVDPVDIEAQAAAGAAV